MTSINSSNNFYAQPAFKAAPEPQTANTSFRGETAQVASAINDNSKACKAAATASIVTSCATLIPLSILAAKTHKVSKVAEALEQNSRPVLEGARHVVENFGAATESMKKVAANYEKKAGELMDLFNSEEMAKAINELKGKLHEADSQKIVEAIEKSINSFSEAVNNKVGEVKPEAIENFLRTIEEKVGAIETGAISDGAKEVLSELKGKIQSVKFSIG